MSIDELYAKPLSYQFTADEIAFIKKHVPKKSMKVKYAIYKPNSSKGRYITFIIDFAPNSVRRSAAMNAWEIIAERDLTNLEYTEMIENFGANKRRFLVYYYKIIEKLIRIEKEEYNIVTPPEFVKKCKDLGYSGNLQLNFKYN